MTKRKLSFVRATSAGLGLTVLTGWLAMPAAAEMAGSDRVLLTADQGTNQSRPGTPVHAWEWWNDADVQKELALSGEKVKRINDFYNRRNAELQPFLRDFDKQREELEKMTRARVADESTYQMQVVRVESLRSRIHENRTVLLYRIYRELTPEQHLKLQEILDRRRPGARGRAPDGR